MAVPLHVKEKSQWKTLKLPEDVLNSEDFSGLIDIQELTDYELVPFEPNLSGDEGEGKKSRKSRKRKKEDTAGTEIAQSSSENDPPNKKKKKRKRPASGAKDQEDGQDTEKDKVETPQRLTNLSEKKNKNKIAKESDESDKSKTPGGQNKLKTGKRKQSTWIVSSKNVEVVTGEENGDGEGDDKNVVGNSEDTGKSKSKKRKRKKKKTKKNPEEAKENGIAEDEEKKTTRTAGAVTNDSGLSEKSKKKKKRKKNKLQQTQRLGQTEVAEENSEAGDGEEDSQASNASEAADMSEWKGLFVPDELLKALQDQKFTKPTVIQRQALPSAIRDRKDVLGAAETGSGKTLAFGIPLLSRILDARRNAGQDEDDLEEEDEKSDDDDDDDEEDASGTDENEISLKGKGSLTQSKKTPPMALILEPTRELAVQVRKHLVAVSKYTNIKFANVVGGMSVEKQRRVLGKSPEVIIATPGRLWQLIEEGNDHLCQVDRVLCLVLDEADRMVEKGHYEELTKLLELINKSPRRVKNRQTFVMSATLTMDISAPKRLMNKGKKPPKEEDKIQTLIEKICAGGKPKVIDLTPDDKVAQTLTELRVNCKADEKDFHLYYFLCQHPGRTLVFANSKDCLRRLVSVFTLLQCSPLPLHADMHQRQRLKNLDKFSENSKGLLVASDVAARGLDIPSVDHVIHYQVPRTMENYVHRSGRTARASKLGLSVMLVGPEDAKDYRKIIYGVRNGEDLPPLPIEMELMPAVKHRVSLAREVDVKEYRLKKKKVKNNFFIKAAEEMDMIIDDRRLLEDLGDSVEQAEDRQQLAGMKAGLAQALRGSLAPLRRSKYPTKSGQLDTKSVVDLFTKR